MRDFVELLKKLLASSEFGYSDEEAARLVKAYPNVVMNGIMAGGMSLRATAMALQMMEDETERESDGE